MVNVVVRPVSLRFGGRPRAGGRLHYCVLLCVREGLLLCCRSFRDRTNGIISTTLPNEGQHLDTFLPGLGLGLVLPGGWFGCKG